MKNKKEYMKQYYAENAEKLKMRARQYYAENAEKYRMQNKQYRAENAENRKMQQKQYYAENAEKLKRKNKQYCRTINGKYSTLISTAKKRCLHVSLSKQEYELLTTNQNCHYCEEKLPEAGHGLDRIDSEQGYTIDNVVPCCTTCNMILRDMPKPEAYTHMRQMLQIYEKKLAQAP